MVRRTLAVFYTQPVPVSQERWVLTKFRLIYWIPSRELVCVRRVGRWKKEDAGEPHRGSAGIVQMATKCPLLHSLRSRDGLGYCKLRRIRRRYSLCPFRLQRMRRTQLNNTTQPHGAERNGSMLTDDATKVGFIYEAIREV